MANGIEEKAYLGTTIGRMAEIFQVLHSLTPEEIKECAKLQDLEEERLTLAAILREIRERPAREQEGEEAEETSKGERIAADYGVARRVTDAVWGKRRN